MVDPIEKTNEDGRTNNPPSESPQDDDGYQYLSRSNFTLTNKYDADLDRGPFFVLVFAHLYFWHKGDDIIIAK